MSERAASGLHVDSELRVRALTGVPGVEPGDDLFEIVASSLVRNELELADGDVLLSLIHI